MNIIVSGASRGIGKAVAIQLATEGHQVIALARNKSINELSNKSKNIRTLAIDLLEIEALKSRLAPLLEELECIDALLNNAGQLINKPFLETNPSEFEQQYQTNVISAVALTQICFPYMNKNSHIVNVSSMGGVQGSSKFSGLSAYSASKGALSILTECLAEEFAEKGVSVNALALGAVQTEMLEKAFPGYQAPLQAAEIAEYIADFLTKGGKYYNGKVLPVSLNNP